MSAPSCLQVRRKSTESEAVHLSTELAAEFAGIENARKDPTYLESLVNRSSPRRLLLSWYFGMLMIVDMVGSYCWTEDEVSSRSKREHVQVAAASSTETRQDAELRSDVIRVSMR